MKFDLSNTVSKSRFHFRVQQLVDSGAFVELRKINPVRSISQNAYYHVCVSLYAIHFGSTLYEAKIDLKRYCPFMVYEKNGKKYLRQTRSMDTKELTDYIDWIRNYAGQNGCYIPTAEEYIESRIEIDRQIDNAKSFL